jgi:hypothetical protein
MLATETIKNAAETLQTAFEEAAERLVTALDAGNIAPTLRTYRRNESPTAIYVIPWSSEALQPMSAAVEVMGTYAANHQFADIFQHAAHHQLQGDCDGTDGAFSFSLNYGETWEEANARMESD